MNPLSLLLMAQVLKRRQSWRTAPQTVPAFAEQSAPAPAAASSPTAVSPAQSDPSPLVSAQSGGVLCGYWFEWEPRVALTDIPKEYNYVCIAFLEYNGGPVLTLHSYSQQEIISGISELKAEGREVLISMGGASGRFSLGEHDKVKFKTGVTEIVETYGFTGVDIGLEGESVKAGSNDTVIPAALREIKDYYRSQGRKFLITMAPEFIYLRGYDAAYKPYLADLEDYYDIIWPQYYNQGADGIWSNGLQVYLSQNDDTRKAEFLYTLTRAIVTGTQDFIKIPADKLAIGLPAAPESAYNGYVKNPSDVRQALDRLSSEGHTIRGLMTWSINQDAVNGYEFAKRYAPMISGL